MEKERVDSAVGLGLMALLAGVYLLDTKSTKEAGASSQKTKKAINKKKQPSVSNKSSSIWG